VLREDSETPIPVRLAYLPFTPLSNISSSQSHEMRFTLRFPLHWLGPLHYFPFFPMGRQPFLHHYFPALYFAIPLSCSVFDLLTSTLRPRVQLRIAGVLVILAIWNFQHYSPLTYGGPRTGLKCEKAKMMKAWDFSW
jgi:dolichyl-phosphate-mannose--protein O-mannosyl transferase